MLEVSRGSVRHHIGIARLLIEFVGHGSQNEPYPIVKLAFG